jgi:hypothetical protein
MDDMPSAFLIRIRLRSGFNGSAASGYGSRQTKKPQKIRKKLRNFMIEDFSVGIEASPGV